MNKKCEERAITVVALVITVIVLLIIAGVSINLAIGNNGILKIAEESSNTYANKTKDEISMMEEIKTTIGDTTGESNSLIEMYKSGRIKTGDYLNYKLPEEGEYVSNDYGSETSNGFATQKYNVNNNGHKINWRVLGLGDDDGNLTINLEEGKHLLLISANPVEKEIKNESEKDYDKDPYLYMGKAECFANGERILNGISNIYVNNKYAEKGRSIKAEDINTLLGIEIANGKVYEKQDSSKTNIDELRVMGNTYTYKEGEYSPSSYLNHKKTAIENGEETIVGSGYVYGIGKYKDMILGKTTAGNLLFNSTNYDKNNSKAYWLANKGVDVNNKAIYGLGVVFYDSVKIGNENYNSRGNWIVQGFGVYPIVSLKSEITIDEIQLVDGEEQQWNYNNNKMYSGNKENYESGEMFSMFY